MKTLKEVISHVKALWCNQRALITGCSLNRDSISSMSEDIRVLNKENLLLKGKVNTLCTLIISTIDSGSHEDPIEELTNDLKEDNSIN